MGETRPKDQATGLLPAGGLGGIILGLVLFGTGLVGLFSEPKQPTPLLVALMVLGVGDALASFWSMRRVRIAWSYSLSINGTLGLVLFLAVPRLRDLFGVHIAVAAIPCLAAILVTTLLALAAEDLEVGG